MKLKKHEKIHFKKIRDELAQCTVLLRSDNSFPLQEPCDIALYGNGAKNTQKGGTGSGEVNSHFYINVYDGLKMSGFNITSDEWIDEYEIYYRVESHEYFNDIIKKAREDKTNLFIAGMGAVRPEPEYNIPLDAVGDVCVYVLSRISGEGSDRRDKKGDILLTDTERRDILLCNKKYKKFMLVLNVGGPVDLSGLDEVKNILLLSQLGALTGLVLGDILLGRQNPSGHLSTTWALWEDYPKFDYGDRNDVRYEEGIYVGYRYFDTVNKRALFPFGHGLSFTTFQIEPLEITNYNSVINVKTRVTNTGRYDGRETVMVYVSCPPGKLDKPFQVLSGFKKTKKLYPGENEELTISFDLCDSASYDEETAVYLLEAGDYILRIGNSSEAEAAFCVNLSESVMTKLVRTEFVKPDFDDLVLGGRRDEALAPSVFLTPEDFIAEEVCYKRTWKINKAVKGLSDSDAARLLVGRFNKGRQIDSIIGNASQTVVGAAGECAAVLTDKPSVMADGPAGLRLSREYFVDENGIHPARATLPETLMDMLPKPVTGLINKVFSAHKPDATHVFQYATAIPVGTAIAQSWNTEFAQLLGDIIGEEMEMFGVNLWLAPALNIHRNIRCGRNFEYFSEDPLLSAKMTAAINRGVSSHKGCGVTIKHLCANNREDNRYFNNSCVSERALREIYLKGFELAIRECEPAAVMTSYNLVNGIHTAQNRSLVRDILRCEFGFRGVVMTDWVVPMASIFRGKSVHPAANPLRTIHATVNLLMPGGLSDQKAVLEYMSRGENERNMVLALASSVVELNKNFS